MWFANLSCSRYVYLRIILWQEKSTTGRCSACKLLAACALAPVYLALNSRVQFIATLRRQIPGQTDSFYRCAIESWYALRNDNANVSLVHLKLKRKFRFFMCVRVNSSLIITDKSKGARYYEWGLSCPLQPPRFLSSYGRHITREEWGPLLRKREVKGDAGDNKGKEKQWWPFMVSES